MQKCICKTNSAKIYLQKYIALFAKTFLHSLQTYLHHLPNDAILFVLFAKVYFHYLKNYICLAKLCLH